MTVGPYKLIADVDGGNSRLFDLVTDPGEHRDVAPVRPDVVRDLRARLRDYLLHIAATAPAPAATVELSDEEAEQLRELGYVQ